ncbi:autophagy-related 7 [Oratosquilla oratoria]|uniref:autophagy-related 7 n=1 Tax=Oratosquilla oratoria TaxID=337810 RepID=UPI003F75B5C2
MERLDIWPVSTRVVSLNIPHLKSINVFEAVSRTLGCYYNHHRPQVLSCDATVRLPTPRIVKVRGHTTQTQPLPTGCPTLNTNVQIGTYLVFHLADWSDVVECVLVLDGVEPVPRSSKVPSKVYLCIDPTQNQPPFPFPMERSAQNGSTEPIGATHQEVEQVSNISVNEKTNQKSQTLKCSHFTPDKSKSNTPNDTPVKLKRSSNVQTSVRSHTLNNACRNSIPAKNNTKNTPVIKTYSCVSKAISSTSFLTTASITLSYAPNTSSTKVNPLNSSFSSKHSTCTLTASVRSSPPIYSTISYSADSTRPKRSPLTKDTYSDKTKTSQSCRFAPSKNVMLNFQENQSTSTSKREHFTLPSHSMAPTTKIIPTTNHTTVPKAILLDMEDSEEVTTLCDEENDEYASDTSDELYKVVRKRLAQDITCLIATQPQENLQTLLLSPTHEKQAWQFSSAWLQAMTSPGIVQYAPFSSAVDAGFWHNLTKIKLEVLQLSEAPAEVIGYYVNSDPQGLPTRLNLDYDALNTENPCKLQRDAFSTHGKLINTNTIEDFKGKDKNQLLKEFASEIWNDIIQGRAEEEPKCLTKFLMFTFADLKKYHYYFWFAFPAFLYPEVVPLTTQPHPLHSVLSKQQVASLLSSLEDGTYSTTGYFTVIVWPEKCEIKPLSDYPECLQEQGEEGDVLIGFADPCTLSSNPGWPLRNLITLVACRWSNIRKQHKVLCLRVRTRNGVQSADHSLILEIDLSDVGEIPEEMPKCLGWEKNEKGKLGPRFLNLAASMDPTRLAESAVDLNLKLMRWRVAPSLNLDVVSKTKCLLLGAGTLGCNVARCLLGWGVRTITLVDSGKVSYSNPVRQSLFVFNDCFDGGTSKAVAAAEALKAIFPRVNTQGFTLSVPMPGHTVSETLEAKVRQDVAKLEELVNQHDAVFLLMDSRESRWLPTLLGAAMGKVVLTAALGFDSYLVMRHGTHSTDESPVEEEPNPSCLYVPGHSLGCYFCNDVVAPGDSMRDRTLDQQCTVTRPGVSFVASALVAELLVSILQHPLRGGAPASTVETHDGSEGVLGRVPHSIRGFIARHQVLTPATQAFNQCTACSKNVLSAYREEGFEFLLKVFNNPSFLEEITELNKLHQGTNAAEIWELSDSESEIE